MSSPRVRFFTGAQGQRIAYAIAGSGPSLFAFAASSGDATAVREAMCQEFLEGGVAASGFDAPLPGEGAALIGDEGS